MIVVDDSNSNSNSR